jgi:hypothetical protein
MLHSNEKQSRSKKTKNDETIKTVIADLSVWPKVEEWHKNKKKLVRAKSHVSLPTRQPSKSIVLDCSKISFEGEIKKQSKTLNS